LDADKEGLFRSETSLIQTIGRAARNSEGKVIMYADTVTKSMKNAIGETNRRRKIQTEYNEKNGITPKTIKKDIHDIIDLGKKDEKEKKRKLDTKDREKLIEMYTSEMREASRNLEFEKAAFLRDRIKELKITKDKSK
jgi:excinuclease ABC subunit B